MHVNQKCDPSQPIMIDLLKRAGSVPHEGKGAVDAALIRESASKLNPIISVVCQADTISQCAALINALGQFFGSPEFDGDSSRSHAHLLTGAIAAALMFESENPTRAL